MLRYVTLGYVTLHFEYCQFDYIKKVKMEWTCSLCGCCRMCTTNSWLRREAKLR